jgi:hypothetical protein
MNHNPELAQTLPARELHELVTGDEYSAVYAELESLPDSDSATIKKERAEILGRLRGLKLAALKQYREKQKENPPRTAKTAKTKDVGHHRIAFEVEARPGLGLQNCHCTVPERYVSSSKVIPDVDM